MQSDDSEIEMFVITSSHYEDCLHDYITTCDDPLRTLLSVYVGHTSRLYLEKKFWDEMPKDEKLAIQASADGFVGGWEMVYESRSNR